MRLYVVISVLLRKIALPGVCLHLQSIQILSVVPIGVHCQDKESKFFTRTLHVFFDLLPQCFVIEVLLPFAVLLQTEGVMEVFDLLYA